MTLALPRATPVRTRTGWLLATILLGQFMAILDVAIVNVAAPTLRADLGASGAALQLIIAGYTMAYAVLLITGARLGDLVGHRAIFQLGLAVFTAASLACGLAGSTGALIACRLVQGAGAALMVPQVLSLIQRHFTGAARARAFSIYSAVLASAVIVGQVLGGLLVSADLYGTGWRPVFLVNVPVGVALLATGHRLLPKDHERRDRGLDLPGVLTLSGAVFAMVLPLVLGHELNWPQWTWLCLAGSLVLFGVFAVTQRSATSPLIPSRVLRAPGLLPALGAILLSMATYGGFLFMFALHIQNGLGYGPVRAGLSFVPGALGFATASLNWRRLPATWHRRLIPVALLAGSVGYCGMALSIHGSASVTVWLELSLLLFGLGLGGAFSPLLTVALTQVAPADAADASGVLATVTQLAQVIGVATFGTAFLTLVPSGSAHAAAVTSVALAAGAIVAAGSALPLVHSSWRGHRNL